MNRGESLITFVESIQPEIEAVKRELVEEMGKAEKKCIWNGLLELCQIVEEVQKEEKDYQLVYIQISLLCAGIASDRYDLSLRAYNQDYFLDKHHILTSCDLSSLFLKLVEFKKTIYNKWSYVTKIELFDLDKIIMDLAVWANHKLADRFRKFFWDFDEESFVKNLKIGPNLIVKWGLEREHSETVFKAVNEELVEEKVMSEVPYLCRDKQMICEVQVQKKAFLFQSFRYGQIKNSVFVDSILLGSTFKGNDIQNGGFLGCNLERCNFQKANINTIAFVQCDLRGSDFKGASFQNVSFTDCNLEGVVFSSSAIPSLKLNSRDLQKIILEGKNDVLCFGRR